MGKKSLYFAIIVLVMISFILVVGRVDAQQAYPTKPVQLIASGGPGSSTDSRARSIEQTLTAEKMIDKAFIILNKVGGGGNVATSYMVEQKGSGYSLAINTNRVILNPLIGTTDYSLKDMTPVVRLTTEYPVWAVRADSKYKSALEVLADVKKDPKSVVFALTSIVSNSNFNILQPAKQYGIDYTKMQIVATPAGGEIITQLLGGHVPIISTTLSEIVGHVDAGKMRLLSVASASRLDRFLSVPTWVDLGLDVVIPNWMGIFGPPEMPKVAYDYWNKKFAEMVKTKTWKDNLSKFELYDAFMTGDNFMKLLTKEEATYTELLGAMGMLKKEKK
jgi:putative tricarboxylic transport membrane protein